MDMQINKDGTTGTCKRYPPRADVIRGTNSQGRPVEATRMVYPITASQDFCGEYTPNLSNT